VTDFIELREFTPEQQARICDVICKRLARDQALPRNPSTPATALAIVRDDPSPRAVAGTLFEDFA
jgi:hypothetical protein